MWTSDTGWWRTVTDSTETTLRTLTLCGHLTMVGGEQSQVVHRSFTLCGHLTLVGGEQSQIVQRPLSKHSHCVDILQWLVENSHR